MSTEESLIILRHWRELALQRKEQQKYLQKNANKNLKRTGTKKNDKITLSSEISKAEFIALFESISETEQVFISLFMN